VLEPGHHLPELVCIVPVHGLCRCGRCSHTVATRSVTSQRIVVWPRVTSTAKCSYVVWVRLARKGLRRSRPTADLPVRRTSRQSAGAELP
jgi:hypothetical protein